MPTWSELRTKLHGFVDSFVDVHEKEDVQVPTVVDLANTPNAFNEGAEPSGSDATAPEAITEQAEEAPAAPTTTTNVASPVAPAADATAPDRVTALEGRVDAIETGIQELLRRSEPPSHEQGQS